MPVLLLMIVLAAAGVSAAEPAASFRLTSTAFDEGASIPVRYTCKGDDLSPPLAIAHVPAGAKSLMLIVDDPDAPRGTWDHWLLFNIDPATTHVADTTAPGDQGRNSWGNTRYQGPCPPAGTHRYIFTLYALDIRLTLPPRPDKAALYAAAKGHVLANTVLMGRFRK